MKKRIIRYIKHISLTILTLATIAILFGLYHNAEVHYGDHPDRKNYDKEGPYAFYQNDSLLNINYIRGNKEGGFYLEKKEYPIGSSTPASCFFPLDSTAFEFTIKANFSVPKTRYNDDKPILAISDIESGYKTFRDFLINNNIIDEKLKWIFGEGHLVLVGDFVDRGFSTTQVLWFIYKLEQDAKKEGGLVHFIIGNHELKNFQGNYESASPKYMGVAAILGKPQYELYSSNSFIGRWMSCKNSMEIINGNLFAHGGIHPDLLNYKTNLEEINQIIRANYYQPYFPKTEKGVEELLISTRTGICWYRGFFKDDLTQEQIDKTLKKFDAKSIVVGHTIQSKVNRRYNGKVIGIDVRHPKDYNKSWPNKQSEGLLIEGEKYYRVLSNGEKEEI